MAKLDIDQVKHIAKLSRLALTEQEEEQYSDQLSSVLSYVEELQKVDTEGIQPTANITGLSNIFREDKIEESSIDYAEIAKNAPEFKDGFFVVPGVFDAQ